MKSKPFVWEGVEYPSIRAMAKATNTPFGLAQRFYDSGYTCRADVVMGFEWEGIHYDTVSQAAEALGVSMTTIYKRIEKQQKSEKDLSKRGNPVPIVIDNIAYKSIAEAARALGVSRQALHQRLNKK